MSDADIDRLGETLKRLSSTKENIDRLQAMDDSFAKGVVRTRLVLYHTGVIVKSVCFAWMYACMRVCVIWMYASMRVYVLFCLRVRVRESFKP